MLRASDYMTALSLICFACLSMPVGETTGHPLKAFGFAMNSNQHLTLQIVLQVIGLRLDLF